MQTVPACQNLYKNSFTYHCLPDDQTLPFEDGIKFLGEYLICLFHGSLFVRLQAFILETPKSFAVLNIFNLTRKV